MGMEVVTIGGIVVLRGVVIGTSVVVTLGSAVVGEVTKN